MGHLPPNEHEGFSVAGTYSASKAGELLGISRQMVYKYYNMRKLKGYVKRCNRRLTFTGKDIQQFWASLI